MDAETYWRQMARGYRAFIADVLEAAKSSDSRLARQVQDLAVLHQRRIEKVKERAPPELLRPETVRQRNGTLALEAFL